MKHYEKHLCMIMLPKPLVFVQIKQMNTTMDTICHCIDK